MGGIALLFYRALIFSHALESTLISWKSMAVLAASGIVAASPTFAGDDETELGLNGRVAFSFAEARGNTDTRAITGEAAGEYVTGGPWLYDARLGFVNREESATRTEERYEFRVTANRYWTPDDYLFGRVDWRKDNFGGVREEWVPGIGYGRVLIRTDRHSMKGEFGAGYRFADLADGSREEGAALSAGIRYNWRISEGTRFFQNAQVQWSEDNTFLESETGLTTNLVGNLNARFTYRVRRNSEVPVDRQNTDFLTTIGLEYQF